MIEKLTPKNVLQMIRDGVNPLEKTFGELESYFAENPQSYEEEAEDYSRFLYQLEQKKDITENERKAYTVSIVWYTRLREKMVPQ